MSQPQLQTGGLELSISELAEALGGEVEGDADRRVTGIAGIDEAGPGDVTFLTDPRYRDELRRTRAAAVIVDRSFGVPEDAPDSVVWLRVEEPRTALAAAIDRFHPEIRPQPGVHSSAVLGEVVQLGEGVHVGAGAVIGDGAEVGERTVIEAGCVVAAGAQVGQDCWLHPNVTLYEKVRLGDRVVLHAGVVVGADGFGYSWDGERHVKIRQVGGVVVGDDVEVGAGACIDRGTFGDTRIGRGTKIDNLVQIGHNCRVGADCILCGQVGLGGSAVVEDGAVIGGQAGIRGHVTIGRGAKLAAKTGVTNDVPAGTTVGGYPHLEIARWRRAMAATRNLPDVVCRVRRLEAERDNVDEVPE